MILIITEKPFVSLHVANALGIQTKPDENHVYEGNSYRIASLAGWIYRNVPSALTAEYGEHAPKPASFPDLVNEHGKAYSIIMELMNAEDTDKILFMPAFIELYNIFDYLMEQCGCTKPSLQMSLNDLTANAIKAQVDSLLGLFRFEGICKQNDISLDKTKQYEPVVVVREDGTSFLFDETTELSDPLPFTEGESPC